MPVELDAHTGLLNRRAWHTALEEQIARAETDDPRSLLTMVLLDIDGMRSFNEAHGIAAGDRLLSEVANALRETCRATDFVARYGGEEFAVLLLGRSRVRVEAQIVRMRTSVNEQHPCTFGVAHWNRGESAGHLSERAEQALRG